jgi:putative restriction endonuclease
MAKPKLKISNFFDNILKAPVKNPRWSWGSQAESGQVYIRVMYADVKEFYKDTKKLRVEISYPSAVGTLGSNERLRHIQTIMEGSKAYAVMCQGKKYDVDYNNKIVDYDDSRLFPIEQIITNLETGMHEAILGQPVPVNSVVAC